MNFGIIVSGLTEVIKHRKEIAADIECAIHFIRRVEHLTVHHKTTADTILVAADDALSHATLECKPTQTEK